MGEEPWLKAYYSVGGNEVAKLPTCKQTVDAPEGDTLAGFTASMEHEYAEPETAGLKRRLQTMTEDRDCWIRTYKVASSNYAAELARLAKLALEGCACRSPGELSTEEE